MEDQFFPWDFNSDLQSSSFRALTDITPNSHVIKLNVCPSAVIPLPVGMELWLLIWLQPARWSTWSYGLQGVRVLGLPAYPAKTQRKKMASATGRLCTNSVPKHSDNLPLAASTPDPLKWGGHSGSPSPSQKKNKSEQHFFIVVIHIEKKTRGF